MSDCTTLMICAHILSVTTSEVSLLLLLPSSPVITMAEDKCDDRFTVCSSFIISSSEADKMRKNDRQRAMSISRIRCPEAAWEHPVVDCDTSDRPRSNICSTELSMHTLFPNISCAPRIVDTADKA